jgi:hypothetical protein
MHHLITCITSVAAILLTFSNFYCRIPMAVTSGEYQTNLCNNGNRLRVRTSPHAALKKQGMLHANRDAQQQGSQETR